MIYSSYQIKYYGVEYTINVHICDEGMYYYDISYPGNCESSDNGKDYTTIIDCVYDAITEICDGDESGVKILIRDIKLDEILN